jgi:hypothetical protein
MQHTDRRSDDDDELVTTEEAAEFLSVSKSFLQKARRSGTGPLFIELAAKVVRYKKSSLRKWRDDNEFRQSRRKAQ